MNGEIGGCQQKRAKTVFPMEVSGFMPKNSLVNEISHLQSQVASQYNATNSSYYDA